MMKLVFCVALALVSETQAQANDVPGCIMANTNAINDMVDSALFIYASTKACDGGAVNACVSDISSVVNSALGVGEFLLKVFKTCGEIETSNYDCSIAGLSLSASLASVSANAASAAGDCKAPGDSIKTFPGKYHHYNWTYADLGTCTSKVGAAMSGLQASITSMMTVKKKCDTGNGGLCFAAVMDIISAVGNLAVSIENIVANCNHGAAVVSNACATDIGGILSGLAATASTCVTIKSKCTPASTRLYQDSDAPAAPTRDGANLLTGMLVVFLPITGLASYFGGSRFKGRQARHTRLSQGE